MLARIKIRRDTQENWTLYNPVLDVCEIGMVLDTIPTELRVGNGQDNWLALPIQSFFNDGEKRADIKCFCGGARRVGEQAQYGNDCDTDCDIKFGSSESEDKQC